MQLLLIIAVALLTSAFIVKCFNLASRDDTISLLKLKSEADDRLLTNARERSSKAEYRLIELQSTPTALPPLVKWTDKDVIELRKFYASNVGQKLVEACRAKVLDDSMKACQEADMHAVGRAAGADELLRWQFNQASEHMLQKLSRASSAQDATHAVDSGTQETPEFAERRVS
jgi:hypothetical protein